MVYARLKLGKSVLAYVVSKHCQSNLPEFIAEAVRPGFVRSLFPSEPSTWTSKPLTHPKCSSPGFHIAHPDTALFN